MSTDIPAGYEAAFAGQAPAEPVTIPEPAAPAPSAPEAPAADDNKVHPAWEKALTAIPDALRGPLIEQIRTSEREAQAAIERARAESAPEEWRTLISEASERGLDSGAFIEAYNNQLQLRNDVAADPDQFIADMTEQINLLVEQGNLTRKQARDIANQMSDDVDAVLTDEQKEIRDLKRRLDEADQQKTQEQQAREEQQAQQAAEQHAQQFFGEFQKQMIAAGFARQGDGGVLEAVVPVGIQEQIALAADRIYYEGAAKNVSVEQAITQAVDKFKADLSALGVQAPGVQQARTGVTPVMGAGSNAANTPTPQSPKSRNERENAMLDMIKQMAQSA